MALLDGATSARFRIKSKSTFWGRLMFIRGIRINCDLSEEQVYLKLKERTGTLYDPFTKKTNAFYGEVSQSRFDVLLNYPNAYYVRAIGEITPCGNASVIDIRYVPTTWFKTGLGFFSILYLLFFAFLSRSNQNALFIPILCEISTILAWMLNWTLSTNRYREYFVGILPGLIEEL